MKLSPTCPVCNRLAMDYEETLADHADFAAEYGAAVSAHDYGKVWELRMAVQGAEMFCRMAKERLKFHSETHGEYAGERSA